MSATIAKGPRLGYLWLQQQWGLQMGMLRAARVVAGRIAIVAVIGLFASGGMSAQTDSVSTPMVVPAADRDAAQRALEIIAGRLRETNAAGMKSVAADPDFNKAWTDFKGYVQAFGSAGLTRSGTRTRAASTH